MVKRQAGPGETQRTQFQMFISKTLSRDPQDPAVSLKPLIFLTKGNYNKKQNLTLTKAIPLRCTMYSYSQKRRCFWNSYNVAWPCRLEPSSDRTVLTTAVCSVTGSGIKLSDPHSTTLRGSGCPRISTGVYSRRTKSIYKQGLRIRLRIQETSTSSTIYPTIKLFQLQRVR